ncbi:Uncharacterised protein [uncultured archaeon]|nr:Uncharacterised protein [uncultured archaeon]
MSSFTLAIWSSQYSCQNLPPLFAIVQMSAVTVPKIDTNNAALYPRNSFSRQYAYAANPKIVKPEKSNARCHKRLISIARLFSAMSSNFIKGSSTTSPIRVALKSRKSLRLLVTPELWAAYSKPVHWQAQTYSIRRVGTRVRGIVFAFCPTSCKNASIHPRAFPQPQACSQSFSAGHHSCTSLHQGSHILPRRFIKHVGKE